LPRGFAQRPRPHPRLRARASQANLLRQRHNASTLAHVSRSYRKYAALRAGVPAGKCRRRTMSCSGRGTVTLPPRR
jgi:hypothetical protein